MNILEDELSSYCNNNKYVFLAGDANSRVGTLKDFILPDPHTNKLFGIDVDLENDLYKHTLLENLSVPLNRNSLDKRTNTHGFLLLDMCKNNNMFIINGRLFKDETIGAFTFRDKSVIDYVLATAESFNYITDFEIIETDPLFSDGHNVLSWDISTVQPQSKKPVNTNNSSCPTWKQDQKDQFIININKPQLEELYLSLNTYPQSQQTLDYITHELQNIFENASSKTFINQNLNYRNNYPNNKPWFGSKCHQSRNQYHEAKAKYNINKNCDNKLSLKHASNHYKRTIKFYVNKEKLSTSAKLREMNDKNPKKYWKFIRGLKPKTKESSSPPLESFHEHFKEINKNSIDDNRFNNDIEDIPNTNEFLNMEISQDEICKCILKLKNSKAPSPSDHILNEYIKSTKDILLPFYTKLFNCVLQTGIIPLSWLEGTIIPIFKNKGSPTEPSNYRPITLLSCMGKLFTSILNQRLNTFLELNNILEENQAGFRKGYSCADHIFTLHALIEIIKKRKQKLFCAFIDFSQAFDKVWRAGLWHKVLGTQINGNFFRVLLNMYSNIKSCVSLNGECSQYFLSEIGVRQGENLSPVLFSLFLNDLHSYLHINGSVGVELINPDTAILWLKLLVLLYADDTVIVSSSASDLQNSLNTFHNYCKNWYLNINITKTKVIIFGARQTRNFNFKCGNNTIEITKTYHYLGVTFSSNGSFLNARKHVKEQASKAMHLLWTRVNNANLPIDLAFKLFDHTVLPILTYGSEIFGYENLEILEQVHKDFMRKITKARRSTPINFLYGELGRYPLSINIKTKMISFWNRLITGKESKISLLTYQHMLSQPNLNFKWLNKIKEILTSVGRPDIWQNQTQITQNNIHIQIKQTLIDQFKQSWNAELQISNKGRIYSSYKSNHEFEPYLIKIHPDESQSIFRFRTANHLLPVETGRYEGIPFHDRLCNLCNTHEIATEKHYLMTCPYFDNERHRYLGNQIERHATFNEIMTPSSILEMKELSKFSRIIMKKFIRH